MRYAFDTRYFARIITFGTGTVGVFHPLRVNDTKARFDVAPCFCRGAPQISKE